MKALDIGPKHYKNCTIEPIEFILANKLSFLEGNIIKYICRYKDKGGIQDLEKAQHYLQFLLEVEQGRIKELSIEDNGPPF